MATQTASTGGSNNSVYNPQQSFAYNGGAFGNNVSQVNLPNPSAALNSVLPGVSGANSQLSGLIGSELSGSVSPDVLNQLTNTAASFGVNAGLPAGTPGNTLPLQQLLENVGINSQSQQQTGVQNYNQTIPTIASTQTLNPNLQYEANLQNATSAAAPNPAAAASEEQSLLQQYMSELQNPAGGEGEGALARSDIDAPPPGDWSQTPGSRDWSPGQSGLI